MPDVPKGYKQTEVGVIPDEWDVKPLRSVLNYGRLGGNYPNQARETEYPLMKMGNIARGSMDTSKVEYISAGVIPDRQHKLINGDVLFNTRNTLDLVGKVAIWRDELPLAYYNSNLMRLEFDPQQVCSTGYANATLNSAGAIAILRGLATGTTSVAAIYTRDLLDIPFISPPLPEQEAIATALGDADALIESLDKLIAKKRQIKQGTMQELLTGKRRLPGFSGEWETKRLGDIASCFSGGTPPTEVAAYYCGEIPWITSGDLNKEYITEVEGRISHAGLTNSSAQMIEANTLLIALYGATSGVTAISKISAAINQAVLAIVPHHNNTVFLYFKFRLLKDWLISTYTQGGQPNLSGDIVKSVELSLPPLPEQAAIAEVLSDMDAEIVTLEARLVKAQLVKQGMMQELLTGRIRLIREVK